MSVALEDCRGEDLSKRVLVVDDEPSIRELLAAFLEIGGYQAIVASNGKEALRLFYENAPDLVITDVIMPDMNGYTFSQLVRYMADTPIMMITGVQDEEQKRRFINSAVDEYMTKPVIMDEFLDRVEGLVGDRGYLSESQVS